MDWLTGADCGRTARFINNSNLDVNNLPTVDRRLNTSFMPVNHACNLLIQWRMHIIRPILSDRDPSFSEVNAHVEEVRLVRVINIFGSEVPYRGFGRAEAVFGFGQSEG